MDKMDWIEMLLDDGVAVDEAIDMAVDFFGIDSAEEENRLWNQALVYIREVC